MGLTPYGVIPHADVKVGDLIEINTITVHSGKVLDVDKEMVKLSTPDGRAGYWTDASPVDFTPVSWTAMSAYDRRVVLVNRPEPPKPAAKVGETLTAAHAEPPVGAKALEIESDGSWLLFERVEGGWCDQHSRRPNWRYSEVVNLGSFVVHLPSE